MKTFNNLNSTYDERETNEILRGTQLSNNLQTILRQHIAEKGAISFAEYMAFALYHPQFGYYCRAPFFLGKSGDFTTAPELSPLFAYCFANQFSEIFQSNLANNILEIGAGTGRFICDVLHRLARLNALPDHYYVYEISDNLQKQQQAFVKQHCAQLFPRVTWLCKLPDHFEGIVFANEVLDAIPVHCFRIEETTIKEKMVTIEQNQLAWKVCEPETKEFNDCVEALRKTYDLPHGYESEINLELKEWMTELTTKMEKAVLFFVDYGYVQKEYYRKERNEGTLTCFYKHQKNNQPLLFPGDIDITAHVDFTHVAEIAHDNRCNVLGFTTQAAFLMASGLVELAMTMEEKLTVAEKINFHQAVKMLTLPTEMGDLIKVLALSKNIELPLSGFRLLDKRYDL